VALLLDKAGITNVKALIGGYEEWAKRGDPIVKGNSPR
jgi:rhodanese-related sulfurtransferase